VCWGSKSKDIQAYVKKETEFVKQLSHPNIVEMYGCKLNLAKQEMFIWMELMKCDLEDIIDSLKNPKQEADQKFLVTDICYITREVACALAYLHAQKPAVLHLDLKPSNILIGNEGEIKVSDFGFSRKETTVSTARTALPYLAPEANTEYSEKTTKPTCKADIYSFGCILGELITLRSPEKLGKNITCPFIMTKDDLQGIPQILQELYFSCTKEEPENRPTSLVIHQDLTNHIDKEGLTPSNHLSEFTMPEEKNPKRKPTYDYESSCYYCGMKFRSNANTSTSCHYHTGKWNSKYNLWDCCNKASKNAKGCNVGSHNKYH